MDEVTIQVFKFSELSKEAKTRAIEDARQDEGFAWDNDSDGECLTEGFIEFLKEKGFNDDVQVYYSLSNCQGDGVDFTGSIDVTKLAAIDDDVKAALEKAEAIFKTADYGADATDYLDITVSHSGRYHHWNSMRVEVSEYGPRGLLDEEEEAFDECVKTIRENVEELIKGWSRTLEKQGYEAIDYAYSDEHLVEEIEAREYKFTSDGERFES